MAGLFHLFMVKYAGEAVFACHRQSGRSLGPKKNIIKNKKQGSSRRLTSSKRLPSAAAARRALASTESLNLPASAASSKGRLSRE